MSQNNNQEQHELKGMKKFSKERLIQQNIKLNNEIRSIQQKISQVLLTDVTKKIQENQKQIQAKPTTNLSELSMQQTYIKKLKYKIKQLKAIDGIQITTQVSKQESQLSLLKKQYMKLNEQKNMIERKIKDKQDTLNLLNPYNDIKNDAEGRLKMLRKQNAQMGHQITQLERQIRKYHKLKQTHKIYKNNNSKVEKVIQNPQQQIARLQNQRVNIIAKIKVSEQKQQQQSKIMDTQYFQTKKKFIQKQSQLKQIQKQTKNWQIRSKAVRNQEQLILNRQRLAKISTSVQLKRETVKQYVLPSSKSPRKQANVKFSDALKNLLSKQRKQVKNKQNQLLLNNNSKLSQVQKVDTQSQRNNVAKNTIIHQTKYATQYQKYKPIKNSNENTQKSQTNEFDNLSYANVKKQQKQKSESKDTIKNQIKMKSNACVGTQTFYFNNIEDD